jgi:hypothetical protein
MNGGPLEAALASTAEQARQLPERNAEDEQLALEAASNATAFASLRRHRDATDVARTVPFGSDA